MCARNDAEFLIEEESTRLTKLDPIATKLKGEIATTKPVINNVNRATIE
jgi:hypothetical protein